MRTRVLRITLAVALIGALSPTAKADACSVLGYHGVRNARQHHFIVVPTARTLSAAKGIPKDFPRVRSESWLDRQSSPREWRWWRTRFERFRDRFLLRLPYGQVVRIERIGGPDSLVLRSALTASNGKAVFVEWLLQANCGPRLRVSREPFFIPGRAVFAVGSLRDRSGWVGRHPTFDIAASDDYDPHSFRSRTSQQPLSLAEYVSLYEALPELEAFQADTANALAPLRSWLKRHPQYADHELVLGALQKIRLSYSRSAQRDAAGRLPP